MSKMAAQLSFLGTRPKPARATPPDIIYTYAHRFSCCIAVKAGWKFGINSADGEKTCLSEPWKPHNVAFVDNEFKNYNHGKHLSVVRRYRPKYCTVRDMIPEEKCKMQGIEYYPPQQIIDYAYELQQFAENVIVIPKALDYIDLIPAQFMAGYSVPTSYGGTTFGIHHLAGRRIHLLGGSWKDQLRLLQQMPGDIVSLDNNYICKLATYGGFVDGDGNDCRLNNYDFELGGTYYVAIALSLSAIANKVKGDFA